jgi:O-antigen/teichoic acid export membrane protein
MTFFKYKFKFNKNNTLELFWISIGQITTIIISFFLMKLLTKMGTSDFGKYSLAMSIITLFSSFLYGPIEQSIIRFFHESLNNGTSNILIETYNYILLTIAFIISLFALLYNYLFNDILENIEIYVITFYLIFSLSSTSYNSIINLIRKRKLNALIQVIEKLSILILIYLTYVFNLLSFKYILIIFSIITFFICVYKFFFINKFISNQKNTTFSAKSEINKFYISIYHYSLPFAIWGIAYWLQSNSEKWVIVNYLTSNQVGLYSLLIVIANYLISTPINLFNQFLQPILFSRIANKSNEQALDEGLLINNYLYFFITLITIFAFFFTYIYESKIVTFIANPSFIIHEKLLPYICLGLGLFNIAQVASNVGIILKLPNIYIWPKIICGFIALGLNIFFVQKLQLFGITISLILTSLIYIFLMLNANRKLKNNGFYLNQ